MGKYCYELIAGQGWAVKEVIERVAMENLKLSDKWTQHRLFSVGVQAFFILGFSLFSVSRCFMSQPKPDDPKEEPLKEIKLD